jgi:hypothetical protein
MSLPEPDVGGDQSVPSSSYSPGIKADYLDTLVAGERYLLQVRFKQGFGDAQPAWRRPKPAAASTR